MYERTGYLINKKFMQFLFPTIFMSMALSVGTIVDGIIVANMIGTEALAAINLCTPVILGFSAIYSILGVGGSTMASTAMGRRNGKEADRIFTIALILLLVSGVLVTIIGYVFLEPMTHFISVGGSLQPLVKDYVKIYIYGAPLFFLTPGMAYFVRTDGNPNLSAIILVCANIVNLVCDVCYIRILHMGISGAAVASLTGYAVGLLIALSYFFSGRRTLHLIRLQVKELVILWRIVLTGLPSALNSVLMFLKITVINKVALGLLGDIGATAVAVCNNCLSFAAIFIGGAAQTMLPIMAVLFGEEDNPGMKLAVKRAVSVVLFSGIIMVLVFEMAAGTVVQVFGIDASDHQLMEVSLQAVHIFGLSLPLYGINYILMCFYQATNRKKAAIFITVVQGILFIVPFVFVFSALWGAVGIWISFVAAEIATLFVVLLTSFLIGKRENRKGLFLEKAETDVREFDLSLECMMEKAVGLSDQVIEFCKSNGVSSGTSTIVGMALEEMTVNTIQYGYEKKPGKYIDVNVKIMDDQIVMRLRDDGEMFNPVAFETEEGDVKTHGIEIVKTMSKSIEYSRVLGFNNLIIKIGC